MKHDEIVGYVACAVETVTTPIQTNQTYQIIQIILAIITFFITNGFVIWKWFKKAKKDGKITDEEIDELFDELENKEDKKDE